MKNFVSVNEIIEYFKKVYPECEVKKTEEGAEELGIIIKEKNTKKFIPVRDSQTSGYFIVEIPKDK